MRGKNALAVCCASSNRSGGGNPGVGLDAGGNGSVVCRPHDSRTDRAKDSAGRLRRGRRRSGGAWRRTDERFLRAERSDVAFAHPLLAGVAQWRRAFNGLAFAADSADIERDLEQALSHFEAALVDDPAYTDAKAGVLSCLGNLYFLRRASPDKVAPLAPRIRALLKEAVATSPDHPRLLWVVGAQQRALPVEAGGGRAAARASYERGLIAARAAATDLLEPRWGEPELLMGMANLYATDTPPDNAKAEECARDALALVPYWRSLRENVLPRIQKARQSGEPASSAPSRCVAGPVTDRR